MSIEQRFRRDRARTSNGYRLAVGSPPANWHRLPGGCDTGPVTTVPGGGRQQCRRGGGDGAGVTTNYPCIDPIEQQLQAHKTVTPSHHADEAASSARALCFPCGMTAAQQHSLAKQLGGMATDDAQQILDELAGRTDSNQVRDPVRYCARLIERFRRGEFHLELGKAVARRRQRDAQGQATAPTATSTSNGSDRAFDRLPPRIRDALERIRPASTSE